MYKIVQFPIEVPNGDFCWSVDGICGYFSNEGGHPKCDLGFYLPKDHNFFPQKKPSKCAELKEVE